MKKVSLITVLMLVTVPLVFGQGSKNLQQVIRIWPPGYDTTGKHWVVYNFYRPVTHFLTETSISSITN